MKILSIEPLSGAAGDMILASLIDLGADPEQITEQLKSAGLTDFLLHFQRRLCKHGIQCGYLEVTTPELKSEQQHIGHAHDHTHDHLHAHSHAHGVEFAAAGSDHELPRLVHCHRGLAEIIEMLHRSAISLQAKVWAEKIFRRLAAVEAEIHGVTPEEIHFHEVGAVDSIVDIFGTCIALELLGVEKIYCPGHKIGHGTVRCAHGLMPVPAPATIRLLEGFPVTRLDIESELTTPTGAAILTVLSEGTFHSGPCKILGTGYGHGRKEFETLPNLLRSILFEIEEESGELETGQVTILEFETDDQSPETLGYLLDKLLAAGALDVSFSAVQMKKNRPGQHIRIICKQALQRPLCEMVLRESSTLGIRMRQEQRLALKRRLVEVETPWGKVTCKEVLRPGGQVEYVPEYEAAKTLAEAKNLPLRQVMAAASSWEQKPE